MDASLSFFLTYINQIININFKRLNSFFFYFLFCFLFHSVLSHKIWSHGCVTINLILYALFDYVFQFYIYIYLRLNLNSSHIEPKKIKLNLLILSCFIDDLCVIEFQHGNISIFSFNYGSLKVIILNYCESKYTSS